MVLFSSGAYNEEESAARAYDLAALKYWGSTTFTNFPVADYETEINIMQNVTKEEYLASLRRYLGFFNQRVQQSSIFYFSCIQSRVL